MLRDPEHTPATAAQAVWLSNCFSHRDRAGSNRFHFSGRVNGRALHVGRYRLQAIANNRSGQRSLAANTSFSIIH